MRLLVYYLRLLDAECAEADTAEIGNTMNPTVQNDHPDYNRSKRIRDAMKAAHDIRDFKYLFIPMSSRKK